MTTKLRCAARAALLILAGAGLSGCSLRLLDPAGPVADAQRTILFNAAAIMLGIIVPTMVATVAFAWWFRAGNARATYRPRWGFSGGVELVTWSVPLLTIVFLGGIAWIGSHELDPGKPVPGQGEPLEVQVVSLDWKWLFIYPREGVASVNRLVLPVGRPLRFSLTSSGVWDSFFVPQLGSMIYTMSGMATRLHLRADREGRFLGLSTHLSGDGFADMTFPADAVAEGAFAEWVAGARAAPDRLDDGAYAALSRQSQGDPPKLYRLADPDLFDRVVAHALPPGLGPERGEPGPSVKPKGGT